MENSKDPLQTPFERRKKPIKKPAIFIEAGSHGREWIGPAVATWIIDSIIKDIYRNGILKLSAYVKIIIKLNII